MNEEYTYIIEEEYEDDDTLYYDCLVIDNKTHNAIRVMKSELENNNGSEFNLPRIEEASSFMQYLFDNVLQTDNNMFFIEEDYEIEYAKDDGFDITKIDVDAFFNEIDRFNLNDVIEAGYVEQNGKKELASVICYGNLQCSFIQYELDLVKNYNELLSEIANELNEYSFDCDYYNYMDNYGVSGDTEAFSETKENGYNDIKDALADCSRVGKVVKELEEDVENWKDVVEETESEFQKQYSISSHTLSYKFFEKEKEELTRALTHRNDMKSYYLQSKNILDSIKNELLSEKYAFMYEEVKENVHEQEDIIKE